MVVEEGEEEEEEEEEEEGKKRWSVWGKDVSSICTSSQEVKTAQSLLLCEIPF